MKSLEKAVLEILHKEDFGHGVDCYCDEFKEVVENHPDLMKLVNQNTMLLQLQLLIEAIPPSHLMCVYGVIMMEVGIRIGLTMATPELDEALLK